MYAGDEHPGVLDARRALVPHQDFEPDRSLALWLANNVDNEPYTIVCDSGPVSTKVLDDGATLGLATIAKLARDDGRRVAISGQGQTRFSVTTACGRTNRS